MDLARALPAPGRHVSTQEAAWSLMAANALIDQASWSGVTLNGAAVDGLLLERLVAGDQTTRTVTNAGEREETLHALALSASARCPLVSGFRPHGVTHSN